MFHMVGWVNHDSCWCTTCVMSGVSEVLPLIVPTIIDIGALNRSPENHSLILTLVPFRGLYGLLRQSVRVIWIKSLHHGPAQRLWFRHHVCCGLTVLFMYGCMMNFFIVHNHNKSINSFFLNRTILNTENRFLHHHHHHRYNNISKYTYSNYSE